MRLAVVADEYPYRTKQILCCEQIANDLKGGAAWHYVITTKMAKLHPSVRDQHDARPEAKTCRSSPSATQTSKISSKSNSTAFRHDYIGSSPELRSRSRSPFSQCFARSTRLISEWHPGITSTKTKGAGIDILHRTKAIPLRAASVTEADAMP